MADHGLDGRRRRVEDARGRSRRPAPDSPVGRSAIDRTDRPTGGAADSSSARPADSRPLLDRGEPLDPSRVGVSVPELHPDHFTGPTADERTAIRRAWEADSSPEHWVRHVNPGGDSDPARMVNCADCSRAVQLTLEGRPTAAAALDAGRLPLQSDVGDGAGEAPDYTEQWSADRARPMTYEQVADELRRSGGSAIVFGYSEEGGHAFNAVLDDSGRVTWIDGQLGEVGEWPPPYRSTFTETEAILFPAADQRWRGRQEGA